MHMRLRHLEQLRSKGQRNQHRRFSCNTIQFLETLPEAHNLAPLALGTFRQPPEINRLTLGHTAHDLQALRNVKVALVRLVAGAFASPLAEGRQLGRVDQGRGAPGVVDLGGVQRQAPDEGEEEAALAIRDCISNLQGSMCERMAS
jgi:hypothetical protein